MVYESILGLGLGLKRFLTVSESVFLTKSFIKARRQGKDARNVWTRHGDLSRLEEGMPWKCTR
jgi:hypothetical protein